MISKVDFCSAGSTVSARSSELQNTVLVQQNKPKHTVRIIPNSGQSSGHEKKKINEVISDKIIGEDCTAFAAHTLEIRQPMAQGCRYCKILARA